jgi:hypothetical protein
MSVVTAYYRAKSGMLMVKTFTDQQTFGRWLERQKREVTVKYGKDSIGGVTKRNGYWYWWYDETPFRQSLPAPVRVEVEAT